MIKNFFKRMIGLDKLEQTLANTQAEINVAEKLAAQKLQEVVDAEEKAEQAKLTPKERATAKGEPWVGVLDTHVNKDNPRNGFFELDWNENFIAQLKVAGYGFDGDPDEEIVDRWFRDLYSNMLHGEGMEAGNRTAGFINVNRLPGGKAEAS